ncbi:MAG TPA: UvrD-helicase domain-containing protein [Bacteroidia bacterium]|nr:UvrD-helicase domain-containing protein [Bacteroidia bacterium]
MSNFTVYRSGAGSGKTFTLVKAYLRLCLQDHVSLQYQFRRILAMTFTNKAAAEMKSRVLQGLDQLRHSKNKDLSDLLCAEIGISEPELASRAAQVLSALLHHYSDFAIGTIDSFSHRLVKTFAHDLQLPVNFSVETDENGFNAEVVDELISRTGEDEYISKLLKEYVLLKTEENKSWDPENLITEFSKLLLRENSGKYTEVLLSYSEQQLEDANRKIRERINLFYASTSAIAGVALEEIRKAGAGDEIFYYKSNGPKNFFNKILDRNIVPEDLTKTRLQDAIHKGKWFGKDLQISPALEQLGAVLSQKGLELEDYINKHYTSFMLCRLVEKQIYPLLLLKKIAEISREKKDLSRLVFISEFNRKIAELVQNEPAPFIYERLGERYRHFLLDEFQDTSSLQWLNLLPLIDNSLSNGWYNLLVGDGKQSIYRWRNANVQQFSNLPAVEGAGSNPLLREKEQNLRRNYSTYLLGKNRRSLKQVVEFNNRFFTSLSKKVLDKKHLSIYADCEQEALEASGGYVSLNTYQKADHDQDTFNLNHVEQYILRALKDGFALRDIAVLCRSNNQSDKVVQHLVEKHIPVISNDSLLLRYNREVNTLHSALLYITNPLDRVSAAVVLHELSRQGRIPAGEMHRLLRSLSSTGSLFRILEQFGIDLREKELPHMALPDLCVHLARTLGLYAETGIHLRFFLDELSGFVQKENANLPAFLFWWEHRKEKASLIIPQDSMAVNVMTMHSSKGLEFPVVIIPYCSWPIYSNKDEWISLDPAQLGLPVAVISLNERAAEAGFKTEVEEERQAQTLENMNLLYVAFTRAMERLHIICKAPGNLSSEVNHWIVEHFPDHTRQEQNDCFEFGELQSKKTQDKKSQTDLYPLQSLRLDPSPARLALKRAMLHNSQEQEDAQQKGILLHWLLSQIRTEQDVAIAIQGGIAQGYFTSGESEDLAASLITLLSHEAIRPYFMEGLHIKTEAEILGPGAEILRPDRIVLKERETIVLDYKSGRVDLKTHSAQVQKYAEALQSMGYPAVRKLLVYTSELKIVELN